MDGQFSVTNLLGSNTSITHTLSSTVGGVTTTTSSLVTNVLETTTGAVGGLTGQIIDTSQLSLSYSNDDSRTLTDVLIVDSSEEHEGLVESLNNNLLSPLLSGSLGQ
ncbi:hypothetical protein ACFSJQ_20820 [Vibrio olivae]